MFRHVKRLSYKRGGIFCGQANRGWILWPRKAKGALARWWA
jgi:hypothetical protein